MNKDKVSTSKVNKDKKPVRAWKRILSVVLALAIAAGGFTVFFNRSLIAEALFNPDDAVIYSTFKTRTTVEDSVLFIGTYIVHKDALTDKIYEDAMSSASDSGQNSIYYKSELSDGQWFDVGDVDNGIQGIASEGTPVPEENIDPLYVTYYAGSDGILRDAKTLAAINPFDIPDPYDLSKLPELQSLWLQYTYSETAESISQEDFLKNRNSADSGNLRSDVYYYQLLSTFFSLDLRDEETNKLDEQLNSLNNLYISLKAAGSDDEAELVYHLMDMVDSKRRALVMERLSELDTNLLNTLYTLATGSYYTPYGNFKDSSTETETTGQSYDYITELQDSLQHDFSASQSPLMQLPWITTWFSRLGIVTGSNGWWTVLDTAESDRKKRAEEYNSENEDYVYDGTPQEMAFNADTSLLDAIGSAMSDCGDSYTKYMSKCLDDKDDVLGHAEYEYAVQVIEASGGGTLGGPVTYLKHVTKIKDNIVADASGELDMLKSTLIGTCSSRYTSKATSGVNADYYSLSSVNARSTSLEDQKADLEAERSMLQFLIDGVRQRDTAANALAFVYERIDWTENLKTQISGDDFKPYATSSVEAHLVWLREEAQRIIDSDESLKSDADRLRDKKEDLQAKRDGALDDNDLAGAAAYDAMIAAVDNDLNGAGGAGSSDDMANQLLDKAMDKLADNANADLSGIADALAGMGADDALKDLADKAAASGASAATLKGINDAMKGDGSGGSGSADAAALLSALEGLFGKSLDEMDDRELAITAATLSRLARSGMSAADELLAQLIARLLNGNNSYLYTQYSSSKTVEYVNMRTLSLVTSYRYFYDESKATATLTSGTKAYIFKRGSSNMYNGSEQSEPEAMTDPAVFQGEIYVGEEDTMRYFKCSSEYLENSEYALCLTSTMQTAIAGYVEALSEMFAAS
ncbi:MAG: hypothetical protein J5509_11005 [Lachnospiraceae bacterium]|nr:hypothetical protein [Lachnospiraceae bacterium]